MSLLNFIKGKLIKRNNFLHFDNQINCYLLLKAKINKIEGEMGKKGNFLTQLFWYIFGRDIQRKKLELKYIILLKRMI